MLIQDDLELESLLLRLQKGDRATFDLIFKRFWDPLLNYLNKLVSDREDAEDLLQNIFISLWNKSQTQEIRDLRSWLYGAARKSALFYHRTQGNQKKLINLLVDYIQHKDFSLTDQHQAKELQHIIDLEISKLPAKMKEVFILSRQDELSHKEIAARLGISDETVKKQIKNALKILRNSLKTQGLYHLILFLIIEL